MPVPPFISMACNIAPTSAFARCRAIPDRASGRRSPMDLAVARAYFLALQKRIVASHETIDGGAFRRDAWTRPAGGGGVSCAIEHGAVLERGCLLFPHVPGNALPPSATPPRP